MSSRSTITLILATLVFVAATLLWMDTDRPDDFLMSELDPVSVQHITVNRRNESDLVFEKRNNHWFLIKPITIRARPARVDAILELPGRASHDRIDAVKADMETMLLKPPLVSVNLNERRFHFGGTDPITARRYVLFGDTIHLIDDNLFPQLNQPPSFFVDNGLLPDNNRISRIIYPERVILLEEDRWLSQPAPLAADHSAAEMVENWRNAEARRVLPYQGADPLTRIKIVAENADDIVFELIPAKGSLLLARSDLGLQYQLSKETAASLGLAEYIRK